MGRERMETMHVIYGIARRYNIEVGTQLYTSDLLSNEGRLRGRVEWQFHRAFTNRDDAEAYANRVAEDYEFVRIIDKGEA